MYTLLLTVSRFAVSMFDYVVLVSESLECCLENNKFVT